MKRRILIGAGLLIIGATAACSNAKELDNKDLEIGSFELNDTFNIVLGTLQICESDPSLFVKFDSLVNDSRCPKDASCIWEGNAELAFNVTYKKELEHITLNTNDKMEKSKSIFGHTITLISLSPYPGDKSPEGTAKTAQLTITKP